MDSGSSINDATLRDYLKIMFRHKLLFVAILLVVMTITYINLQMDTPKYAAVVSMLISAKMDTEADYYQGIGTNISITTNHTLKVKSTPVLERVVDALKLYQLPLDYEAKYATNVRKYFMKGQIEKLKIRLEGITPEQRMSIKRELALNRLRSNINVSLIPDSDILTIMVKDYDPVFATVIANSVSRSYIIFDMEQQIAELKLKYGEKHSTVVQLESYIREFEETLDGRLLSGIDAIGPASVKIVEQAVASSDPINVQQKGVLLGGAFFVSMVLGVLFSFGFEYMDQTVKMPKDLEQFFGMAFLGSIPRKKKKDSVLACSPDSVDSNYTRAFHDLTDRVYQMAKEQNLKTVLLTDVERSDTTEFIVANLGMCLSQKMNQKVVLVDANFRESAVSKFFNISSDVGLVEVLSEQEKLDSIVQNPKEKLYVLPPGNTAGMSNNIIKGDVMNDLINTAAQSYDLTLITCEGIKDSLDASIIAPYVDGVILVINEGQVRRQTMKSLLMPYTRKKVNFVGAIITNRRYELPEFIYRFT
ncbi:MAG: hypothetical protein H8D23_14205 [Candidatus Brocadiales bacterium]|nr:hypothetical protein [Candidatus Brocadiales bacterium]